MRFLLVIFSLAYTSATLAVGAEQCALRGQSGENAMYLW